MLKTRTFIGICLTAIGFQASAEAICQGIDAPALLPGSPLQPAKAEALCDYFDGAAVLVVNTASQCGFTPQFKQLEQLYQRYQSQGLRVLGFPSDNFGGQEYADAEQTATVCYRNFGVSFPVFQRTDVKGPDAHPLFARLAEAAGKPGWNFHKYLITEQGISAFRSSVSPLDTRITQPIERALQ